MTTYHGSKDCCTIPPVEAEYTAKGEYATINGLKTYKTGPADSKAAIILIYDVFGITPQIKQGADLLASTGKAQVLIPDFLEGQYCKPAWFVRDVSPELQAEKAAYFGPGGLGSPPGVTEKLNAAVEELKGTGIEKFAVVGYCWGAKRCGMVVAEENKIVALATVAGTSINAAAVVHPSMLDPDVDGKNVTVPFALLPSKGEDAAIMKAFYDALTVPKYEETFSESVHGWMTTRADLTKEDDRKYFHKGYETVLNFFIEHAKL